VDTYGHLISGANVSYVDWLDTTLTKTPQRSATRTQTLDHKIEQIPPEAIDLIGGGGWTRASDLRIMRCGFRRAATRIQALTVGIGHLHRDCVVSFGI